MIDKTTAIEAALDCVKAGDTIMVGGFGVPGTPFALVKELLRRGCKDLTLIKNEANEDHMGVSRLIEAGLVRRLITSHLGLNQTVIAMMNRGEIAVEFYPQGILAEKIRAGGAGLAGILTDIGIDTILRQHKQTVAIDGREVIVEPALRADVALIHAAVADRCGNLVYAKSARNFNPAMATAANRVLAEAETLVDIGRIDPDAVHTPGGFVDCVIPLAEIGAEYGILSHHASKT